MDEEKPKSRRGFAAMSPERIREIARKGGSSVPKEKRAFVLNPKLASKAGKKGGKRTKKYNRTFSRFPEIASAAGRKGGAAKSAKMRALQQEQQAATVD